MPDSSTSTAETVDPDQMDLALLATRRNHIKEEVLNYIHITFNELGVASAQQTEELRQGLEHIKLEEQDISGWESSLSVYERMIESAQKLVTDTESMLNDAVRNESITTASKDRWMRRLRDPASDYKRKEYYVYHQLPTMLKKSKEINDERNELEKDPDVKMLDVFMIPELGTLLDKRTFRDLHFDKRKHIVSAVKAAKLAHKNGMDALYNRARDLLEATANAGFMSENKIGVWLKRLFGHGNSMKEIEEYMQDTLRPYIKNWTKVRYRFDRLERRMEKEGVPQGFNTVDAEKFLGWEYPQRLSYVEELENRMGMQQTHNRTMDNLKLQIRHALDTEDWEEAQMIIDYARGEATGEDVHEIESMQRYLDTFRNDEDEDENATASKIVEEMRADLALVPAGLRALYVDAMARGYSSLHSVCTLLYNRVWCHENGYLDEDKEHYLQDASKEETQLRIEYGHERTGLENINLDVAGDKMNAAIRPYRNTWAPTVLHMNTCNSNQRGALLGSLTNRNYARDYWTTLVPTDISYGQQSFAVKNIQRRLKGNARKLQAMGLRYTEFGSPVSVN